MKGKWIKKLLVILIIIFTVSCGKVRSEVVAAGAAAGSVAGAASGAAAGSVAGAASGAAAGSAAGSNSDATATNENIYNNTQYSPTERLEERIEILIKKVEELEKNKSKINSNNNIGVIYNINDPSKNNNRSIPVSSEKKIKALEEEIQKLEKEIEELKKQYDLEIREIKIIYDKKELKNIESNINNNGSFITNFIKILDLIAWPITLLIIGFCFRPNIVNMFSRISELQYKGFKALFNKNLSEVEENTEKIIKTNFKNTKQNKDIWNNKYLHLLEISRLSSRSAISEAWRELESTVNDLIEELGYDINNVQISKIFRNILHENNYSNSFYEDYKKLKYLRNEAIHIKDFVISPLETERYIRTALEITSFIENLNKDDLSSNTPK